MSNFKYLHQRYLFFLTDEMSKFIWVNGLILMKREAPRKRSRLLWKLSSTAPVWIINHSFLSFGLPWIHQQKEKKMIPFSGLEIQPSLCVWVLGSFAPGGIIVFCVFPNLSFVKAWPMQGNDIKASMLPRKREGLLGVPGIWFLQDWEADGVPWGRETSASFSAVV